MIWRIVFLLGLGMVVSAEAQPNIPQGHASTNGLTLDECYRRAQQASETTGISEESVRLTYEQYRSKLGAVFPHLDWIKQQIYQDKGGTSGAGNPLQVQPISYFQLSQPIFAGLQDWTAVKMANSLQYQSRLNRRQADLDLLSNVATAYYTAVSFTDTLDTLRESRRLTADRIGELNRRVNIGRSRQSEVLSAQSQLATLDAEIEDAKRSVAVARQLLQFLTKIPPDVPLLDNRTEPRPYAVQDALSQAGKRPDLMSTEEALRQAELGVRYAKGAHWPVLGLTGRYFTERVGALSDVHWDATFALDVPLYSGGSIQAEVRQARSQEIIARLTLGRLRRSIEQQVRSTSEELNYSISRTAAYKNALELSEKNYEVQQREYRLGLISNLEVLQVLTNLQSVRQQWVQSRASAKLNEVRLRIEMGEGL